MSIDFTRMAAIPSLFLINGLACPVLPSRVLGRVLQLQIENTFDSHEYAFERFEILRDELYVYPSNYR